MDVQPLVTIAIPFFNREDYLGYAILSVINQTYDNWEMILIDDGSSDESLKIANSYAKADKRIRVVADGHNKGLAVRLNETINMASGEYYARMDDDDVMVVNRIETQLKYMLNHEDVDVVGSSVMIIDTNNTITHTMNLSGVTSGFIHPTIMAKTQWFKDNPYNEKLRRSQDYELWLRTQDRYRFYNFPQPLLFYREFDAQSLQKKIKAFKSLSPIYRNYKAYGKSFFWFVKRYVFSCFKLFVYWACHHLGFMDQLNKKKWSKELPVELCLNEDNLRESLNS